MSKSKHNRRARAFALGAAVLTLLGILVPLVLALYQF